MDEVEGRLKETSEACIKAYSAWEKDKKSAPARETLQETVHELRKVASRVEIEVAVSERGDATQSRIPIPSHRSSAKGQSAQEPEEEAGDSRGNTEAGSQSGQMKKPGAQKRRNPRKQSK